jgi:hypothetical protein
MHTLGGKFRVRARHALAWLSACAATFVVAIASGQSTWIAPYPETGAAPTTEPVIATDSPSPEYTYVVPDASYEEPDIDDMDVWRWRLLPSGLAYRAYLAGPRESRMGSFWAYEKDQDWMWDIALGGRAALLRYGTGDGIRPQGYELQIEGAGLPRLGMEDESDVQAVDYRFGVPLVYAIGNYQTKIAYYHLSSHLGDEFMIKNPGFTRINYVRDEIVWGHGYFLTPQLRAYGEIGYAFNTDGGAEPWELQFGLEHAPACPTGFRGAPFAAANAQLREENSFSGNLVIQAGWAWRGEGAGHLLRTGFEYFNGKDEQYSFVNEDLQKLGVGLWYDF